MAARACLPGRADSKALKARARCEPKSLHRPLHNAPAALQMLDGLLACLPTRQAFAERALGEWHVAAGLHDRLEELWHATCDGHKLVAPITPQKEYVVAQHPPTRLVSPLVVSANFVPATQLPQIAAQLPAKLQTTDQLVEFGFAVYDVDVERGRRRDEHTPTRHAPPTRRPA